MIRKFLGGDLRVFGVTLNATNESLFLVVELKINLFYIMIECNKKMNDLSLLQPLL